MRAWWLIGGSAAMGVGIWSMHFTGMLAFHLPAGGLGNAEIPLAYDIPLLLASVGVAIGASLLALAVASREVFGFKQLVVASLLLGGAIAGMHYVGMASMRPGPTGYYAPFVVASVIVAIAASYAALWVVQRLRGVDTPRAGRARAGAAIVMGAAIYLMHYTAMRAAEFAPSTIVAPGSAQHVLASGGLTVTVIAATVVILGLALGGTILDRILRRQTAAAGLERRLREEAVLAREDAERLAMQLQDQATELEQQVEQAHALAYDLERANEQLQESTIDAESARDAAVDSERRRTAMLESITDLFFAFDREFRVLYLNPPAKTFLRPLGVDLDRLRGRVIWDAMPGLTGTEFQSEMTRALTEDRTVEYDAYFPPADTWFHVRAYPTADGLTAYGQDVTERRRADDDRRFLADATTRLATAGLDYDAALHEAVRAAVPYLADYASIDVLDEDGRVRRVATAHRDPAKERVLRELWSRFPYDADAPTGAPLVLRTAEPQLVRDIPEAETVSFAHHPEQLEMLRKLGPKSYLAVPLLKDGRVVGALSLVMSDSDRRFGEGRLAAARELAARIALATENAHAYRDAESARARAEEASRAKTDFLATMSHELRTPLNAIIGYTSLLDDGITGDVSDVQHQQLGRIGASARHLLMLIEEILTLARVEARKETIFLEPVDVRGALDEAAVMVEPLAAEKGLRFDLRYPDDHLVLETDSGKLRQALINLVSNAVKFTEQSEVSLGAASSGGWVNFEVRDTGIGIAPEHVERIFDSFWQVERRTTRRIGGAGLGLSVTRHLARLLGGDVTVESAPGAGSTFCLRLPIHVSAARRKESEQTS